MAGLIRVLVVDDSAFVRKVVSQMLSRSPFLEVVGTARDGADALDAVARLNPDVVTLDLVMPGVDGLEFLRQQMAIRPLPVVVCSISHESGAAALEALELGAVDFVQKPTALATDRVFEMADDLVAKVKAAADIQLRKRPLRDVVEAAAIPWLASEGAGKMHHADILLIGVSTGGPQALRSIIPKLAPNFPVPIAVVLHMPVGYTEMFAQRLNDVSQIEVVEAVHDEPMRAGVMFLAPAGQHLTFVRSADGSVRTRLDLKPADTPHRPSVDVMFQSAADVYGPRVLGVVLTGMGNDGMVGSAHIKAKGGRILTEAEGSCVVYGMPRAVVEAGISDRSAMLSDVPSSIMEMI